MANPFLMMDDEMDAPPVQMTTFETNLSPQNNADANSNPFLMQADDELDEIAATLSPDNPFAVAAPPPTQRPPSSNPFAFDDDEDGEMMGIDNHGVDDFLDEDIKTNVVVTTVGQSLFMTATTTVTTGVAADHAMSFFGTTISDEMDKDNFGSDYEEELELKAQKTAHDLILSVADQLDQNSSHMLGRIPVTRTPSPVSMRDLHSPSPEPALGDLLDVDTGAIPVMDDLQMSESDSMSNIPQMDDNPFMSPTVVQKMPPRPPPPRPPARPVSPAMMPQQPIRPPPPAAIVHHQQPPPIPRPPQPAPAVEADLFDIFGDVDVKPTPPRPPVPKSKEDILSLFSTPSANVVSQHENNHNQQQDLLSMDNDEGPSSLPPPMGDSMGANFIPMVASESQQPSLMDQQCVEDIIIPNDEALIEANPEPLQMNAEPEMEEQFFDPTSQSVHRIQPTITETLVASLPPSPDEFEEHADHSSAASDISQVPSETNVSTVLPDDNESTTDVASPPFEEEIPVNYAAPTPVNVQSPPAPVVVNPFADDGLDLSFEPAVPAAVNVCPQINAAALDIFAATPASDEFDAFAAKFDSVSAPKHDTDIFLDGFGSGISASASSCGDAWGAGDDVASGTEVGAVGFEADDGFDSFMAMEAPLVAAAPIREDSHDSDDAKEFNVVIRPKDPDTIMGTSTPVLAPPPPKSSQNNSMYSGDSSPRFNPFDKGEEEPDLTIPELDQAQQLQRTDSQETPPTPLFDEDVSQPLEDFPRTVFSSAICWEMQLRQPNKKKITGQRFWKKIFIKLVYQGDSPVLQLFSTEKDKEPFQELPLQACYSVSDIGAQQYDQFGKIFTVKLQYIFYKERPGVRPGQVTKAERLTNKLSQFAAYAIQGDYQGVKEFGSDLKKLGLPVEHAPQISQLFKIGSMTFEDLKQFSVCVEEALFKMNVHRDRALNYKMEEVQITAVDELYVEQTSDGAVTKQIARVRLFFLGFLSGMPSIELGLNDLWRQGKEVVGRHDIIPVVTEEWIRMEGVDFHMCVQQDEYERSRTIKFQPPDACYIELMRFRVRPPKNRELPLQLKATWVVTGNKVELRADILVPGFASRKLGQIPCEDVSIRFPIPECWIYLFRVEKHFRYGSVKSAHRRTGKIKGIERILGTVDTLQESLIEVTSGQAKYEHHHRAIVWRCPRLPKEGQGAYTTHQMVVRMALTSFDQVPEQLAPHCFVEFTMPATQVSHVTVRSVSVQDSESDEPPEKYVRYLARHEYTVGIEHTTGDAPNAYLAATATKPAVIKEEPAQPIATSPMVQSDSDSDSN